MYVDTIQWHNLCRTVDKIFLISALPFFCLSLLRLLASNKLIKCVSQSFVITLKCPAFAHARIFACCLCSFICQIMKNNLIKQTKRGMAITKRGSSWQRCRARWLLSCSTRHRFGRGRGKWKTSKWKKSWKISTKIGCLSNANWWAARISKAGWQAGSHSGFLAAAACGTNSANGICCVPA